MNSHVEIIGQGQPLVMLHGWGMHSGVWHPLVKRLAQHYLLYLIDLPGMGGSRPIEPYHLHSIADEVAQVMDRVRRLVLVSSTPKFVSSPDWQAGVDPAVWGAFADKVNHDYKATLLQFLTLQCMKADDRRGTIKQLRQVFETKPTPTQTTLQRALRILLESDIREEIPNIRKPTLLIHGDRDTLAPVQAAHWMMQQLPIGFLRVISGAAHAPFLSHSEQFIETLNQFLEPQV
jgi:pimeloyl-[acyl-carrier protein] methyl ester esterase